MLHKVTGLMGRILKANDLIDARNRKHIKTFISSHGLKA